MRESRRNPQEFYGLGVKAIATCQIASTMNNRAKILPKIFKLIQASNTVTVFAASVMAIALLGGGLVMMAADTLFRPNYSSGSAAIATQAFGEIAPEEGGSATKLELEGFSPLSGTPYLVADQVAKQYSSRGVLSSSYGKQVSTRNYLFFDGDRKTSQWLRPNSDSLFLRRQELTQMQADEASVVQKLLYSVVNADSNEDQQLDARDLQTVALSDPSGKNYRELIQNIEHIEQIHQQNQQRVLVFYTADEKPFVADIDFTQGKVITTEALPLRPE